MSIMFVYKIRINLDQIQKYKKRQVVLDKLIHLLLLMAKFLVTYNLRNNNRACMI